MKEDSKIPLRNYIFLSLILCCLLTGCNGQKKAVMAEDEEQIAADSPLTLVAEGNYAQTDSVQTLVITSEKGLSKFFRKINMTRKPGVPIPKVDFSKDMVVIYCAGTNGNGSQPRLIVSEETVSELVIGMENLINTEKPTASVSPYRVYTMPTTTKEIRFKAMK